MFPSFLRKLIRRSAIALARAGLVEPFVFACARQVHEKHKPDPSAITILALNGSRFRGDMDCLARTGHFRILVAPFTWQGRFYSWFYEQGESCFDAGKNTETAARQSIYEEFLRSFLPKLYARLGVDVVLGAGIHYKQDYDWGRVSHELGIPFIIMHREGNVASKAARDLVVEKVRIQHQFHGTKLIVHNDIQRQLFIDSSYIDEENCIVTGNLRMDNLVTNSKNKQFPEMIQSSRCPKVTLFSFGPAVGVYTANPPHWPENMKNYFYNICRQTHVAVALFAMENKNVDVVIKPKWGGNWIEHIHQFLLAEGINPDAIPNLQIDADINVHELLRETDVVVGFGSTTMLEAGILNLPVIMPYFAEGADEKWRDHILFHNELGCFDIAGSPGELAEMIGRRLENPDISPQMEALRRTAFNKYISPLDGSATEKTSAIILEAALASREVRNAEHARI